MITVRFELFIAVRYLRARRRQAVVGLVTGISVVGVAAGVAALIVALAITNGMRRDLQDRLVGATAQVQLLRIAGDGIAHWQPLLSRLTQVSHVVAAAPGLYGQVLISRGPRSGGALIKGIVPSDELRTGNLLQAVNQGSYAALDPVPAQRPGATGGTASITDRATPPLVIGHELAITLGATVGDTLLLTSPQGELTPLGLIPRYQRFVVVGIFSSGFYQYDTAYAFMRLADAQRLFSEPDLVSVFSLKLDDLNRAPAVAHALEQVAGPGYQATSGHVHRARVDRCRCGAKHSQCTHDDGDGKNPRHRCDDEFWRDREPDSPYFPTTRHAHFRHWYGDWPRARLRGQSVGRALPLYRSASRSWLRSILRALRRLSCLLRPCGMNDFHRNLREVERRRVPQRGDICTEERSSLQ